MSSFLPIMREEDMEILMEYFGDLDEDNAYSPIN